MGGGVGGSVSGGVGGGEGGGEGASGGGEGGADGGADGGTIVPSNPGRGVRARTPSTVDGAVSTVDELPAVTVRSVASL